MDLLKKIKEINNALDIKNKTDYVFKKWIFILAFFISIGFFLIAFFLTGSLSDHLYLNCPIDSEGGKCFNPLYLQCNEEICSQEVIEAGTTYGEPPPKYIKYANVSIWIIFFSAFLLNHLIYNKGRKFKLNVEVEEGENEKDYNNIFN